MYFEALKIFCDVVRLRSFSRAAALNHISQSAASQNVLQLEKSLGVRLLDRSKRPFQLTPEGQIYYEGCRTLVDQYYAVEAEVKSLGDEVAGTVSVAAIYSVGLSDMSTYVREFARLYPRARVRLAYLHPYRVVEAVANEEMQVGLVSYPRAGRGLVAVPWRDEPMALVCAANHPLASRKSVVLADLAGQAFVAFAEGLTIRKELDRQFRRSQVDIEVVMAFDNIETIKRAVEIGEGVSILPENTVQAEMRAGTLAVVPLTNPTMSRPMGIIHRKRPLPRTVRAFIDLIRGGTPTQTERTKDEFALQAATGAGHAQGDDGHTRLKVTV